MSSFKREVQTGGDQAVGGLGQKLKGVFSPKNLAVAGVAGGIALAGAITAGLAGAVKALIDIERLNAQTDAAIRSTGGVANVTRKGIEELGESMESLTTIERETVQEASNMLLTFTNVRNEVGEGNDIFNQATEAAANLSVALGTDMTSAAMLIGKALNDPVKGMTAMTRAGIQFTEQQKDMIKSLVESGDMLGAQAIILGELETQFGGSAEAFANTTAGKIARFQNDVGNMFESIILGAVKVSDAIGETVDFMALHFGEMGDRANELAEVMGTSFDDVKMKVKDRMDLTGESVDEALTAIERRFNLSGEEITTSATEAWAATASVFAGGIPGAMQDALDAGMEIARKTPGALAGELREGIDDYDEALEELTEVAVNSVSDLAERQKIEGILASQQLTDALNSDSTRTRLMALDLVDDLISDYQLLAPGALAAGELVNPALQWGIEGNLGLATTAGEAVVDAAGNPLLDLAGLAYASGFNAAAEFGKGLTAGKGIAVDAAFQLAQGVAAQIAINSEPKDHNSPLYGITKWGGNVVKTIADGIYGELGVGSAAANALAGALVPSFGTAGMAPSISSSTGSAAAAGNTININAPTVPMTPRDIGRELRRTGAFGVTND